MEPFLTVAEITGCIKRALECNPELQDVWVAGEVGSVTRPPSGHVYFTLKDDSALLNCVMWKTQAGRYGRLLQTGDAVLAHGRISVYEPRGAYQLTTDALLTAGAGRLYQEFENLKQRLASEGLFDAGHKRPLPEFPRRIGVVTSASGAALRDILNVLGRRYPLVEVVLSPTLVQGAEAPPQIVAAIEALSRRPDVDVVIVARGGGSLEELWAFNDERVARAIYGCRAPVISGVGHETDFTIADFVADLRAPTPSAAAELAVPHVDELQERVTSARLCLSQRMTALCSFLTQRLTHQQQILKHYSPQARVNTQRQTLDTLMYRAAVAVRTRLAAHQAHVGTLAARLTALNPEATLQRGYAVVSDRATGHTIESIRQARPGQPLNVRVKDGQFGATVD